MQRSKGLAMDMMTLLTLLMLMILMVLSHLMLVVAMHHLQFNKKVHLSQIVLHENQGGVSC